MAASNHFTDLRLIGGAIIDGEGLTVLVLLMLKLFLFNGPDNVRAVPQPLLELARVHRPIREGQLPVAVVGPLRKVALVLAAVLALVDAEAVEVAILELAAVHHKATLLRYTPDPIGHIILNLPLKKEAVTQIDLRTAFPVR